MENQIERDVYVTHESLKNPISYVRGTDALPIVFHFRDYDILPGASASVFVAKPSGKAVYNSVSISGNDVTVTVDSQMFMELGTSEMQVSISQGGKELVQFAQPVNVKANLKAGDFPDSSTSSSFLDDMIAQAQEAVNNANIAAQQAQTAVQNANLAVSNANDAVDSVNAMISSMGANFSSLAQSTNITQLQTTSKNLVGAINELNSNSPVTVTVKASNTIKIQSLWDSTPTVKQERQTIFIFGLSNGETVCGVICLFSSEPEASRFDGQGNVGVTLDSYGIITITLPKLSWDNFVLISGYPINFT